MYARPRGPRAPDQQRRSSMHQVRCRSHVSGRHAWTDETNCQNAGGSAAACDDPVWAKGATSGTQASVVLVNGMTQPVLTLEANTWYRSLPNHHASPPPPPPPPPPPSPPRLLRRYRFRMVFAAVDAVLSPWVAGCTIRLLAKDGVYLHSIPRTITDSYMGPGSAAGGKCSPPCLRGPPHAPAWSLRGPRPLLRTPGARPEHSRFAMASAARLRPPQG